MCQYVQAKPIHSRHRLLNPFAQLSLSQIIGNGIAVYHWIDLVWSIYWTLRDRPISQWRITCQTAKFSGRTKSSLPTLYVRKFSRLKSPLYVRMLKNYEANKLKSHIVISFVFMSWWCLNNIVCYSK